VDSYIEEVAMEEGKGNDKSPLLLLGKEKSIIISNRGREQIGNFTEAI
jgi:hypothetical protein